MKGRISLSQFCFIVSAFLYGLSLTQDGFCVQNSSNCWPGYFVVPFGWLEFVAIAKTGPFPTIAWGANPLWLAAMNAGFRGGGKKALYFSFAALMLGLAFFLAKDVAVSEAGGAPYLVTSYGPGLWLWLSSFAVATVASLFLVRSK